MKYALSELNGLDRRLSTAGRVLLATDFDGTVCPLAQHPADVRVSPAMMEVLRRLSRCERFVTAILSGRSLPDLVSRVDGLDAVFAGNHGLEMVGRGIDFQHREAESLRPVLSAVCSVLAAEVRTFRGAWVEQKGLSATLHYRALDPRLHKPLLQLARRIVFTLAPAFRLRAGKCALELRSPVDWDKGSAVRYVSHRTGNPELWICLGDDRTDETMFRANPDGINIKVGVPAGSSAGYFLTEPGEVAILLGHVLGVCGGSTTEYLSAVTA